MPSDRTEGTAGYAETADAFFRSAESITFEDVHHAILHLIPTPPADVLDIGAGTGRDAAAFAAMGHRVVAVEPTDALRTRASTLHPAPGIEWIDDSLPSLSRLASRGNRFDLVMLTAVWMHLDEQQRLQAMRNLALLIRDNGLMIMSLRHGPIPQGKHMFDVTREETVNIAAAQGLRIVLCLENQASAFARTDVNWTRLAFSNNRKTSS
jgi:2-polyprenyl-3-methyl-5-hydroxy-6-metoxy-1,4-benzoquinol methylase